MPLYEYVCPDCELLFEKHVKIDESSPPCPKCGGDKAHKVVSPTTFQLKGGGWAKDGY